MPDAAGGGSNAVPAAPSSGPQRLCRSDQLAERGSALLFDVVQFQRPLRAFAMRFDGVVVAYLNRCVHVPVELDWQPGEFLDAGREYVICSVHGATYRPADGRCIGGPCGRAGLTPVTVAEQGGEVYWYPSATIRPADAVRVSSDPAARLPGSPP